MARKDDISATEKLLEVIRSDESPPLESTFSNTDHFSTSEGQEFSSLTLERDAVSTPQPQPAVRPQPAVILNSPIAEQQPLPAPIRSKPARFSWGNRLWPSKGLTIGIDVQPELISIAKISKTSSQAKLVGYQSIALTRDLSLSNANSFQSFLDSDGVKGALKGALASLCDNRSGNNIWCSLGRDFVEIYNISIPKVPDKEIANAVYWTTKKETNFEDDNVVLDFSVIGEHVVNEVKKLVVLVFLASRLEVEAIKRLFLNIGFPLTGVTAAAIGIENLLKEELIPVEDQPVSHLHIGAQESYIDVYSHGQLIFSRDIKTGIGSFVESLIETAAATGIFLDEGAARDIIFEPDGPDLPTDSAGSVITPEAQHAMDMELPATTRLIRQLERTFDYCTAHYGTERVKRLYVSGVAALRKTFVDHFEAELGIGCRFFDPFDTLEQFMGSNVPPAKAWPRYALTNAIGLALAHREKATNFLYTFADKKKHLQIRQTNQVIAAVFIVLVAILAGTFVWHKKQLGNKENNLQALMNQLPASSRSSGEGSGDQFALINTAKTIKDMQLANQITSSRYFQVAILGELFAHIPEHVKLTGVTVSSEAVVEKTPEKARDKPFETTVTLDGAVTGDPRNLEFVLAGLLRNISGSTLIQGFVVTKKTVEEIEGSKVMLFTITIHPKSLPFDKKAGQA